MEDTCKKENCWFYILTQSLVGDKIKPNLSDCPFYQEMIFTPTPIGEKVESAKTIRDCTNKRSLLILLEEVYPRLLAVEKSQEQMRNKTGDAVEVFKQLISDAAEQKVIEMKKI